MSVGKGYGLDLMIYVVSVAGFHRLGSLEEEGGVILRIMSVFIELGFQDA